MYLNGTPAMKTIAPQIPRNIRVVPRSGSRKTKNAGTAVMTMEPKK